MRRLLAVLAALLATACRPEATALRVCAAPDSFKPELVAQFQREQGCAVDIDSRALAAATREPAGPGEARCDLLLVPGRLAQALHRQGLLLELDQRQLPNLRHVDPTYLRVAIDGGMRYSAPYLLTISGIGWNPAAVGTLEPTWGVFDRAVLRGRATLLDDPRETLGAALKFLGRSLNTREERELEDAREVVLRWKRNLGGLESARHAAGLAGGGLIAAHGSSVEIYGAAEENEDVAFLVPREGAAIAPEDLVIPKAARQARLAAAFVNFLHDPKVAAETTNYFARLCPNAASYRLLEPELRGNQAIYIPREAKARCEVIADLGADNAKYERVWAQIKAAP